jgi:hypothetical protein
MIELADGQFTLGDDDGALLLGPDTQMTVGDYDLASMPDVRDQDADMPGEDGVRFGIDRLAGLKIELSWTAVTAKGADAWATAARNLAPWHGDAVRTQPGAVTVLRTKQPGRVAKRVYGRPRRAAPTLANRAAYGAVAYTADFAGADRCWYADAESSAVLPIAVGSGGGWSWPLSWPARVTSPATRHSTVQAAGDLATWPVLTFAGPVADPVAELYDEQGGVRWRLALKTSLAYDQQVTVDPRPWARTALRGDGANMAGSITRDSARMPGLVLPPGTFQVRFTGTDDTGTASLTMRWRDAWASP